MGLGSLFSSLPSLPTVCSHSLHWLSLAGTSVSVSPPTLTGVAATWRICLVVDIAIGTFWDFDATPEQDMAVHQNVIDKVRALREVADVLDTNCVLKIVIPFCIPFAIQILSIYAMTRVYVPSQRLHQQCLVTYA